MSLIWLEKKKMPLKVGPDNIMEEGEVRKWVLRRGYLWGCWLEVRVGGDRVGGKKENGFNANPRSKESRLLKFLSPLSLISSLPAGLCLLLFPPPSHN